MQRKTIFRCTVMRGGTSKGIFLMEKDLPRDRQLRDRIILSIFGSPDIRQIDGLGGADSLTSKLAIISPSKEPGQDIHYTFGAVGIDRPFVDYSANCGNISSAVGPFAIDQGFVKAEAPFTIVKIFNTNTQKMIHAKVPVERGKVVIEGDYAIDGVPGTGAKIELSFFDPGGAATGRLLPTGNARDEMILDSGEKISLTIVDAGNPTAFLHARDLGLKGTELPSEFDHDEQSRVKLEGIRRRVAELMGIPLNPSIPKVAFIAPPQDYITLAQKEIRSGEIHFIARAMAMGRMHKVFPITGGIPAAIAAVIPGSVIDDIAGEGQENSLSRRKLNIGHPSGILDVEVEARQDGKEVQIVQCTIGRTARKIMEGKVYIPNRAYLL
ncbi:MAG TPA: PrpF domain-containing protein [Thermodesulfobacteriota bacterium]|nr:PrpF domain-containing protein [Thermodesulfobacteriota bacterium]